MTLSNQQRNELEAKDYERIPLTAEGIKKLEDKLAFLKRVLPERAMETKRTADYGDRSENDEYKQAKSLLRSTHRQILLIEDQLKRAVRIDAGGVNPSGLVQLGSSVTVESQDGSKKTFQIVGALETDPSRGRISNVSPLGEALIGRKLGDTVKIVAGARTQEYRIVELG